MSAPRLVVVTPTFHPEPIGTPVYVTDIVRWFKRRGYDVEVVTAMPFYPRFERMAGYGRHRRHDVLDGDIDVLRLPTIVPRHGRYRWRAAGDANFALQGLLRAAGRRADLVLSVSPGVPWVGLVGRALRKRGGRHVMLVHDVQWGLVDSLRGQMFGLATALRHNERQCMQLADTVAVLTDEMGDAVRELGVTKPIVVTPLWATIDADPALVTDGPLEVQYSGNFGEKQGVSVLLTFGERLAEEAPEARLVLRGAGPRFDALRVDAAARRLDVQFDDPVPDGELAAALARSPVHLSVESVGGGRYAMPSKVVNALAAGALVVAMAERRSPLTNLASELSGVVVVPVGDVDGAVDEAARLLRAPDLRDRRLASQKEAAELFSRDAVLQTLESAINGGVPATTR